MSAIKLTEPMICSFVEGFDTVLFDCDGVLWMGGWMGVAGAKIIGRAAELVNYLKDNGKQVFYVTNNSTKTRSQYLEKLTKFGFKANENEIATSGYLVARYLQSINFEKTVYLIGSAGFAAELDKHGIKHTAVGPDVMPVDIAEYVTNGSSGHVSLDKENVGAVVVGFDEHLSYPKILKAVNYLRDPQCLFLASNADETFPTKANELTIPESGTMVTAVQTPSGREPRVFGKPFTAMFEAISQAADRPIVPSRTLMIGDKCNTDILFGKSCQLQTLLVLTGVTTLKQLEMYIQDPSSKDLVPDYYTDSVEDILLLQNL